MRTICNEKNNNFGVIFLKVAIVGSRDIENTNEVYQKICSAIPLNCTEIVSGGAIGVDTLAERYAKEHGLPITVFLPEYEKYGKNATLLRNTQIVKHADKILVFMHNESRGSVDTANKCLAQRKDLEIHMV